MKALARSVVLDSRAIVGPIGPLERHPVAVYLIGLAPGSRRTQRAALEAIARLAGGPTATIDTFPWATLDIGMAEAIRAKLAEQYAPATANRTLAALRGVVKAAFKLGLVSAEQYARIGLVQPVRGSRVQAGRALSGEELGALLGACDGSYRGARDAALVWTLYGCGLRRAELAALDVGSLDVETWALTVQGKGNKQRTVYVAEAGRTAVRAWLDIRGDEPGPLFCAVYGEGVGRVELRRMASTTITYTLQRLADIAGVADFSAHDMRRTFAGDHLDAGTDLATVQALMGHSSPTTTVKYDRRGDRAKQRAAGALSIKVDKRTPMRDE
jgi:integrase/recombinase XerD